MPLVDKRYAEALVEVAENNNTIETAKDELGLLADMYVKQPEIASFFQSPEIGKEDKKKSLVKIFEGSTSKVLPFLELLIDKDRIKNLPDIFKEFVEISDRRKKVLHMDIFAAAPVSDELLNKVMEKYKKEYNATQVKVSVTIEAELIGGIKVKIGDRVIDGTIKGRLEGLKDATLKM